MILTLIALITGIIILFALAIPLAVIESLIWISLLVAIGCFAAIIVAILYSIEQIVKFPIKLLIKRKEVK